MTNLPPFTTHKFCFWIFLIYSFSYSLAQTPCGTDDLMDLRYQENPSLREIRNEYEQEIQSIINSRSFFSEKIIPVVVHIIYNDTYSNISDWQVNSAINAINEDFNANNSDFNNVVSSFSSVKADMNISFSLANIDPEGNNTNGITRTYSDYTDNADENVKSLVLWDTDRYLNIWVVETIESGSGGYAYYPGFAPNGAEGIVIRHQQFGTTGTSDNNNFAATTLTHEVGHYLNLYHTWGSTNDAGEYDEDGNPTNNCSIDDGVEDTPNCIGKLYGCPLNQSTCGSLDNIQNYMEYTDCSNMFTNGQRTRAHAALHSSMGGRINLWQYENLLATGVLNELVCNEELITVQVYSGQYPNEISWIILDDTGEAVAGGGGTYEANQTYYSSVCLATGSYSFQANDNFGDGWNGGYYYVRNCDNNLVTYDTNPTGSQETQYFELNPCYLEGCTNPNSTNYNPDANQDDGSCIILGCTDQQSDNFNPDAEADDGSCYRYGCSFNWADNFDPYATISSGTLPSTYSGSTDSQMNLFFMPSFINALSLNNLEEAYIVAMTHDQTIVGSIYFNDTEPNNLSSGQGSITLWGDDPNTSLKDGALEGEEIFLRLVDGDSLFAITTYNNINYSSSTTLSQSNFESIDPLEYCYKYGCTSEWADNFDLFATNDDGSCYNFGCMEDWADNYDSQATEDDVSCKRNGCTSEWAINFDGLATEDDGSCYVYGCTLDWADNYNPNAIEPPMPNPNVSNTGINMTVLMSNTFLQSLSISNPEEAYIVAITETGRVVGSVYFNSQNETSDLSSGQGTISIWGDDATTPEIDGAVFGENIYFQLVDNNSLYDLSISPFTFNPNGFVYQFYESQASLYNICTKSGCTLDWADNYDPLATENDSSCYRYGCINEEDCNHDILATINDQSCTGLAGCLDDDYIEFDALAGCNNQDLCFVTWQQAYLSSQEELELLNDSINILNTENENINIELISCIEEQNNTETITINLISGWNMIGYTRLEAQDVPATLEDVQDIILIVKNNGGDVYWPEFGFNGIGDFIPGQGYQIKVTEAYNNYSYPNIEGRKLSLIPMVPQWVTDMEIEMHPNDIRTIVKVVNIIGQEVDPKTEPKGTVLIYLYNDATVEKKLAQ